MIIGFLRILMYIILIILFLIFLLIFSPIKYEISYINNENYKIITKIRYLFNIVRFNYYKVDKNDDFYEFKFLFFTIKSKNKANKRKYSKEIKQDFHAKEEFKKKSKSDEDKNNKDKFSNKDENPENKINNIKKLLESKDTSFKIKEKLKFVKNLYNFLKEVIVYIMPNKLEVDMEIGFEDPSETGLFMGFVGVLKSKFNNINVKSNFNEKIIKGHMKAKGKVRPIYIIYIIIKFYRNDENKKYINKLIKKGGY